MKTIAIWKVGKWASGKVRIWTSEKRRSKLIPTFPLSHFPTFAIATSLALWILSASSANARINLVTLPGRNSVQLTIYNSADLTLVKETRLLTFRKGLNRLEFSWANTLIDA